MISTAAVSVLCRRQDGKLNELYVFVSGFFFVCKKMKEFFYLFMNRLCLFIYFWSIPVLMEDKKLQYTHTHKKNEFAGHISTIAQTLTMCATRSPLNLPRDHLLGCENHSEVQHKRGIILNAAFVSGGAFTLSRVASNSKVTLMLLHSH